MAQEHNTYDFEVLETFTKDTTHEVDLAAHKNGAVFVVFDKQTGHPISAFSERERAEESLWRDHYQKIEATDDPEA